MQTAQTADLLVFVTQRRTMFHGLNRVPSSLNYVSLTLINFRDTSCLTTFFFKDWHTFGHISTYLVTQEKIAMIYDFIISSLNV